MTAQSRRRPAIVTAGAIGTVALALSMSGTLSGFTASIVNDTNTAGSGTLTMQETSGSSTCNSNAANGLTDTNNTNASCSSINKYGGGSMVIGTSGTTNVSTATVAIKNTGTLTASAFTLLGGACTQTANPDTAPTTGTAADFCSKLAVKIDSGTTNVYTGTAAGLAGTTVDIAKVLGTVAPGATVPFTFTVTMDPSVGNSYQGLKASQPLTWTFNA